MISRVQAFLTPLGAPNVYNVCESVCDRDRGGGEVVEGPSSGFDYIDPSMRLTITGHGPRLTFRSSPPQFTTYALLYSPRALKLFSFLRGSMKLAALAGSNFRHDHDPVHARLKTGRLRPAPVDRGPTECQMSACHRRSSSVGPSRCKRWANDNGLIHESVGAQSSSECQVSTIHRTTR